MKTFSDSIKKSKKIDNIYIQIKQIVKKEIIILKEQYNWLTRVWRVVLWFELLFFFIWIFFFVVWLFRFTKIFIFYFEWYEYLTKCSQWKFEFNNRAKCEEYSKTLLWKYFIKQKDSVDEEEIVKRTVWWKYTLKDILKKSSKYEKDYFKIKESDTELDMRSFSYLDNTYKPSYLGDDRVQIDAYFKIHTIWKSLDEKTVIFTLHPSCTGEWYDWSFSCDWFDNFDIPIMIKLIYCDNWKVIDDVFEDCPE